MLSDQELFSIFKNQVKLFFEAGGFSMELITIDECFEEGFVNYLLQNQIKELSIEKINEIARELNIPLFRYTFKVNTKAESGILEFDSSGYLTEEKEREYLHNFEQFILTTLSNPEKISKIIEEETEKSNE